MPAQKECIRLVVLFSMSFGRGATIYSSWDNSSRRMQGSLAPNWSVYAHHSLNVIRCMRIRLPGFNNVGKHARVCTHDYADIGNDDELMRHRI